MRLTVEEYGYRPERSLVDRTRYFTCKRFCILLCIIYYIIYYVILYYLSILFL